MGLVKIRNHPSEALDRKYAEASTILIFFNFYLPPPARGPLRNGTTPPSSKGPQHHRFYVGLHRAALAKVTLRACGVQLKTIRFHLV